MSLKVFVISLANENNERRFRITDQGKCMKTEL
jgi:hypothetical protein